LRWRAALGVVLSLGGATIAIASLHADCSAETIPGMTSGLPTCSTTVTIATLGVLISVVGFLLLVQVLVRRSV